VKFKAGPVFPEPKEAANCGGLNASLTRNGQFLNPRLEQYHQVSLLLQPVLLPADTCQCRLANTSHRCRRMQWEAFLSPHLEGHSYESLVTLHWSGCLVDCTRAFVNLGVHLKSN
jgi:hypothetical protein